MYKVCISIDRYIKMNMLMWFSLIIMHLYTYRYNMYIMCIIYVYWNRCYFMWLQSYACIYIDMHMCKYIHICKWFLRPSCLKYLYSDLNKERSCSPVFGQAIADWCLICFSFLKYLYQLTVSKPPKSGFWVILSLLYMTMAVNKSKGSNPGTGSWYLKSLVSILTWSQSASSVAWSLFFADTRGSIRRWH